MKKLLVNQTLIRLKIMINSFENNDRQVILAKADGNPVTPPTNLGPSNFPTPPSGGRPSRPVKKF